MGFQYCGFNLRGDQTVYQYQAPMKNEKFKELLFTPSFHSKDGGKPSDITKLFDNEMYECKQLNVCIGWTHILVATEKGVILLKKQKSISYCSVIDEKGIVSLSTGWNKTIAINYNGECIVWKDQHFEETPFRLQNINGSHKDRFFRVDCGGQHTVLVTESGKVGEIFQDQANSNDFIYKALDFNFKIQSVVCGKEHVLLKSRIGVVFSYGLGSRGQLGHGSTEKVPKPKIVEALHGVSMVTIAAGGWHSAAISDIGDLYLWGWNESGQIGLPCKAVVKKEAEKGNVAATPESVNIQPIPNLVDSWPNGEDILVTEIACGSRHTAAVSDKGALYTWGWNNYGQLGLGDTVTRDRPTEVCLQSKTVTKLYCGYWNTVINVEDR